MKAIFCSATPTSGRAQRGTSAPLSRTVGVAQPRLSQVSAQASFSNEQQTNANAPFSGFVRPDLPPPGPEKPRAAKRENTQVPEDLEDFNTATTDAKPRFRSALEQVSYFTNAAVQNYYYRHK